MEYAPDQAATLQTGVTCRGYDGIPKSARREPRIKVAPRIVRTCYEFALDRADLSRAFFMSYVYSFRRLQR